MGVGDVMFSANDIENLADKLALLYIKKSSEEFSDPKDLARRFVKVQELIVNEWRAIRGDL